MVEWCQQGYYYYYHLPCKLLQIIPMIIKCLCNTKVHTKYKGQCTYLLTKIRNSNCALTQQSSSSVKKIFLKCWAKVTHHGNLDSQGCAPPTAQLTKAITAYVPSINRRPFLVRINQVKLSTR